jgi:hypothetical protein
MEIDDGLKSGPQAGHKGTQDADVKAADTLAREQTSDHD